MLADFEKIAKPKKFFAGEKVKIELYNVLNSSVKSLAEKYKEMPVAFSGGLDSSIMAFLVSKHAKPILFCAGFENSHDAKNSEKSAKDLGFKLETIYFDDLDLKEYLEKTAKVIGTRNRLITDLNVPLYIILERLKEHRYTVFISGQGADTLFGGFARYPYNQKFADEMFLDIKNICKTNLCYNFKLGEYFGIKPIYPFLEKEVVELALKISPNLKIKNGVQKYILREAFREHLPEEIIERKKKSFQYGSGIHRALRKFR